MANDVAQTFAERRRRVEALIAGAQAIEDDVETGKHSAEQAGRMIVVANSRRLQAICEHLGLRAPPEGPALAEPEGEDPSVAEPQ